MRKKWVRLMVVVCLVFVVNGLGVQSAAAETGQGEYNFKVDYTGASSFTVELTDNTGGKTFLNENNKQVKLPPGNYTIKATPPEGHKYTGPMSFEVTEKNSVLSEEKYVGYVLEHHQPGFSNRWGTFFPRVTPLTNLDENYMVKDLNHPYTNKVMYCYNYWAELPLESRNIGNGVYQETLIPMLPTTSPKYQKHVANTNNFDDLIARRSGQPGVTTPGEMMKAITKIIFSGYPNDGANLRASIPVTDFEFEYVTQLAIWKYTDFTEFYFDDTTNVHKMYQALIDVNSLPPAPANTTLEFYSSKDMSRHRSGTFQNLVGTEFVPVSNNITIGFEPIPAEEPPVEPTPAEPTPAEPNQPEPPAEPTPAEPTPAEPNQPEPPAEPTPTEPTPVEPNQPEPPADPTPAAPVIPENPAIPDQTPGEPGVTTDQTPGAPGVVGKTTPKTGDPGNMGIIVAALMVAGATVLVVSKVRKTQ